MTFFEGLMVLFVVSCVSFIAITGVNKLIVTSNLNYAVSSFTNSYDLMRLESMASKTKNKIKLFEDSYEVYYDEVLFKRVDLKHVVISDNYGGVISSNKRGNISRAGTVTFKTKFGEKNVVFYLGEGNYVVK